MVLCCYVNPLTPNFPENVSFKNYSPRSDAAEQDMHTRAWRASVDVRGVCYIKALLIIVELLCVCVCMLHKMSDNIALLIVVVRARVCVCVCVRACVCVCFEL